MIITPDSHTDKGRTSISAPDHHVIQADIYDIQSKIAWTTSGIVNQIKLIIQEMS